MPENKSVIRVVGAENPFRTALKRKVPLIGIWSMLNSSNAVEGLGYAGFDWLLIDGEHSPASLHDVMAHLRAIQASNTAPIVRLAWNDPALIKRHLDAGAQTLMLPFVQNRQEAEAAVSAMHYPPLGQRGVASMHRASRYGHIRNYVAEANSNLFLIVQVETREALSNLESIAQVDRVDAIFFGPGDLAASFGYTGRPDHADVTAAITDGLARVHRCGKYAGVLAPSPELARQHLRSGFDFVSVANDCSILFQGADALASQFSAYVANLAPAVAGVSASNG